MRRVVAAIEREVLPEGWSRPAFWTVVAAACFVVLLTAAGAIVPWSFGLFVALLVAVVGTSALAMARVVAGKEVLRAARAALVGALALAVPLVFDPHTLDVFNLPKYTLVVVGAIAMGALAIGSWLKTGTPPRWRHGLEWPMLAWLAWTALATATSADVHLSLLGAFGSYDGLYSTLAFVVLAFGAAEALDAADVRTVLGVSAFGAGSVMAFYGLLQLHDLKTTGPRWDFVRWAHGLPFHNVFSTLGNPNHMAGELAILLPAAVILGLGARRRLARVGSGLLVVAMLALIVQSAARGAWVAMIVSLGVLAVGAWPELRRRPLVPAVGTLLAVGGAVAVLMAGHGRFIGSKLSTLFASGPSSSVAQRFDLWTASLRIGARHPLVGTGPDTFRYVFTRYESESWIRHLGFGYVANGAHDLFMNALADEGFVGLALLVALLGYAGLRALDAWRRIRQAEREAGAPGHQPQGASMRERSRGFARQATWGARLDVDLMHLRLDLAMIAAGITAYVVQAVFNVNQIALSWSWWLMAGLLGPLTATAGVPDTLRPARLLALTSSDGGVRVERAAGAAASGDSTGDGATTGELTGSGRASGDSVAAGRLLRREARPPQRAARRPTRRPTQTRPAARSRHLGPAVRVAVGVLVAVVGGLLGLGADGPWRADHAWWAAVAAEDAYHAAVRAHAPAPVVQADAVAYFREANHAMALNPWEPTYPAVVGADLATAATRTSNPSAQRQELLQARTDLERAVVAAPLSSHFRYELAQVLADLGRISPTQTTMYLDAAIAQARVAVHWAPRDPVYRKELALLVKERSS
jgi:O-antigen ligase